MCPRLFIAHFASVNGQTALFPRHTACTRTQVRAVPPPHNQAQRCSPPSCEETVAVACNARVLLELRLLRTHPTEVRRVLETPCRPSTSGWGGPTSRLAPPTKRGIQSKKHWTETPINKHCLWTTETKKKARNERRLTGKNPHGTQATTPEHRGPSCSNLDQMWCTRFVSQHQIKNTNKSGKNKGRGGISVTVTDGHFLSREMDKW